MHTARPEVHQTNAIIYPHGTVIRSSTNLWNLGIVSWRPTQSSPKMATRHRGPGFFPLRRKCWTSCSADSSAPRPIMGVKSGGLRPCCFFTIDFRWLSRSKINSIGTLLGCLSPVPWRPGGTWTTERIWAIARGPESEAGTVCGSSGLPIPARLEDGDLLCTAVFC